MWKSTRKVPFPKKYSTTRKCPNVRLQSTNTPQDVKKSGIAKTVVALVGATALGTAGVIGYAKYDPKFRKTLEENIPFSKDILSALPDWNDVTSLPEKGKGIIEPIATSIKEKFSSPQEPQKDVDEGILKKRLQREAKKKKEMEEVLPIPSTPLNVANVPDKPASKPTEDVKKRTDRSPEIKEMSEEELKRRLFEQETRSLEMNDRLETSIKESLSKLESSLDKALTAQCAAMNAIKHHTKLLYNTLDTCELENLEDAWKSVNAAMAEKMHSQEQASKKLAEVKDSIRELKSAIQDGRESKITTENPILISAEESINKMLCELEKTEGKLAAAHAESNVAAHYKSMIEKGKEQFRKELESIVPNVKIGEKGNKLSEEELNFLIVHAHKRVEQLQKQLAKQQVTEQERVQNALIHQKDEDGKVAECMVQAELSRQKRELEIEYLKKKSELKEEFERELRQQLRRQAAAHSEHIQEVLKAQEKHFEKIKEKALEEKIVEERCTFQKLIGSSICKLNGIEDGLKAREELDRAAKGAQELWLACQSLKESIRRGQLELRPLCSEVDAIRRCVDSTDGYIAAILNSIPQQALTRGVYTEEALKERFRQVDKVCRRVALIDSDHRNLYHYFLSFVQSFLILDGGAIPKEEICNKVGVDPSEWNTFDILKRVRYSIIQEDLQQALRYANQLTGEPKLMANSWIQETLLLLETRQAIEALIAHAAAISIQAYH